MPQDPKPGMLVEDETVCAGTAEDGSTVIAPKTKEGHMPEGIQPTDPRERKA